MRNLWIPSLLVAVATLCGTPNMALAQRRPRPKVVAYIPNWIDLKAAAPTFDYAKLTHINVAFENPTNDAGDFSFHKENLPLIAAAHAHHIPILLSIGGGSAAEDKPLLARYAKCMADENRGVFVAKIAAYLEKYQFDGLDVDLEGPAIIPTYGAFVHDLVAVLKPKGKLLTAALSQGYGGKDVPTSALADFDFVNIMAYDATGPWNPKAPGQHSSLAFAKGNVEYWLGRGLPKSKAVMGVPFYGWGFGEAAREGDYAYSRLLRSYLGAENLDQVGNTIYYNGLPTIKAKAKYVVEEHLAGMMIWTLDYDVKGEKSLLSAMYNILRMVPPAGIAE